MSAFKPITHWRASVGHALPARSQRLVESTYAFGQRQARSRSRPCRATSRSGHAKTSARHPPGAADSLVPEATQLYSFSTLRSGPRPARAGPCRRLDLVERLEAAASGSASMVRGIDFEQRARRPPWTRAQADEAVQAQVRPVQQHQQQRAPDHHIVPHAEDFITPSTLAASASTPSRAPSFLEAPMAKDHVAVAGFAFQIRRASTGDDHPHVRPTAFRRPAADHGTGIGVAEQVEWRPARRRRRSSSPRPSGWRSARPRPSTSSTLTSRRESTPYLSIECVCAPHTSMTLCVAARSTAARIFPAGAAQLGVAELVGRNSISLASLVHRTNLAALHPIAVPAWTARSRHGSHVSNARARIIRPHTARPQIIIDTHTHIIHTFTGKPVDQSISRSLDHALASLGRLLFITPLPSPRAAARGRASSSSISEMAEADIEQHPVAGRAQVPSRSATHVGTYSGTAPRRRRGQSGSSIAPRP